MVSIHPRKDEQPLWHIHARRALRAYEIRRAFRAALGVLPVVVLAALAAQLGGRPEASWAFGAASGITVFSLLWYGKGIHRSALPGLLAGMIPLACSLCANCVHPSACDACSAYCVPACTGGGLLSGFLLGRAAKRHGNGLLFLAGSSAVSLGVGAMGCACAGSNGVAGLVLGYCAGALLGRSLRPS